MATVIAATVTAGLAQSADASTLVSKDCGDVAANGACISPASSYGGNRCTLFRLANGGGVNHVAILFDVRRSGTQMDVYSPVVNIGSSITGRGENDSASPHHYLIYQVTC